MHIKRQAKNLIQRLLYRTNYNHVHADDMRWLSEDQPSVQLKPNDIFIVSYPRSGNTLLRAIVAYILYSDNHIQTLKDLDWLVPDIHRGVPDHHYYSSPRVIKTHRPYHFRHCRQNKSLYSKFIYIVRNPFDVAISFFDYQYRIIGKTDMTVNKTVYDMINGTPKFGSWQGHLLSWEANQDRSHMLLVKYEDIQANPTKNIAKIANFLGKKIDDKRINRIRQNTSIESMRELAEKGSLVKENNFIRQQHTGRNVDTTLSDLQKEYITEAFRYKLKELYWDRVM